MSYIKKYMTAFVVIYGCFIINGCAGNKSPIPEPDCEPKWFSSDKYKSTSTILYGIGVKSSHSRQAARVAAQASANREILTQLQSHIKAEFDDNLNEIFSKGDLEGISTGEGSIASFHEGIMDNVNQITDMTCTLCRRSNTEDCQNQGIWESYFMSNLNIEEWKQTTWDPIIDQAINNAGDEIKEQRDVFHKRHELD